MKRLFFVLSLLMAAWVLLPQASRAQDLVVTTTNISGYTNSDGVLTIQSAGTYSISMESRTPSTNNNYIIISATGSDTVSVILSDVHIDLSSIAFTPAFDITGSAPVKLLLAGTNSLASGSYCAGLQKSNIDCNLTLGGNGSLTATGGSFAAGIGGGAGCDGCNITITSGTITATGVEGGAGIGGGYRSGSSNITITGGNIKATGNGGGQNIGNGANGSASAYTPTNGSNGSSNLTCYNYTFAGLAGKNVTNFTALPSYYNTTGIITDSEGKIYLWLPDTTQPTITATCNEVEYVGNGNMSKVELKIVTSVTHGYDYQGTATRITKPGSYTVSMASGIDTTYTNRIIISAAGSDTVLVTLSDVHINLSSIASTPAFDITGSAPVKLLLAGTNSLASGSSCAGLQKGGSGSLVLLGDGNLTATGGTKGAGIGGGSDCASSDITITGGILNATGGDYAAGIGGGYCGASSNITITGGTLTAKGGSYATGIGGGFKGAGSYIAITGGTLTATGGGFAAGIGGGSGGAGTHITITGGTITATGGYRGAGIGSGLRDGDSNAQLHSYSAILITGGTITATGGLQAAGIGGGRYGGGYDDDGIITITGGSINATGNDGAQNIGNGLDSGASSYTPTNGSDSLTLYTYTFTGLAGQAVRYFAGLPTYFGTKDIKTDASGNIYLYLPSGYSLTPKVEDSCSIATGYGTLCYPAPVPLINDVTAYTLTGSDANGYVTYTQMSDTIPAHTPVLLFGAKGASLARPTVLYNASASSLSNGVMKGTYTAISAPVGSYVLQKQNTLLAFYKVATGKQPDVKAFRGYVQLTGSGINVLRIGDGTLDGIETPVNDNETLGDFTIYDLAGRKVLQPVKGEIYIVNGKKSIFK